MKRCRNLKSQKLLGLHQKQLFLKKKLSTGFWIQANQVISYRFDPPFEELFSKKFLGQFFEASTLKFSKFFEKNFTLQEFGSRQIRSFLVDLTPLLKTLFEKKFSVRANLGAPRDPKWARILRHPFWIIYSPKKGVVKKNSHFGPDLH